jgi:hypothetical protein
MQTPSAQNMQPAQSEFNSKEKYMNGGMLLVLIFLAAGNRVITG